MNSMEKMIKELKEKKKGKEMSPMEQKVKRSLAQEMGEEAKDVIRSQMKGLKKVTVAAQDKEGLEEGLDKAKEIVEEAPEMESHEEEEEMEEPMTLSQIEEKMKELEALKAQMMQG